MNGFTQTAIEALRFYVYRLEDPRRAPKGRTFYVGKGNGNRAFQHASDALTDPTPTDKLEKIREIIRAGKKPTIVIHRHGLDEPTAIHVEAALIDAYGVENLTNEQRGRGAAAQGMMTADEVIALYEAPEAKISEPVMLIKIERKWRPTLSREQLYERTRRYWVAQPKKRRPQPLYAMTVARGLIRRVYRIEEWEKYPSESAEPHDLSRKNPITDEDVRGRIGFIGQPAEDMRDYIGRSVRHLQSAGAQNPIKYVNC